MLLTREPGPIRVWTAVQYVTAPFDFDGMDDLPPKMQDTIVQAVEKLADQEQLPLKVVALELDEDHDYGTEGSTAPSAWFLRIVVSEIVAKVTQQPVRRVN